MMLWNGRYFLKTCIFFKYRDEDFERFFEISVLVLRESLDREFVT